MAIGGAFLGGGVEVVPAGYCKLEIQIMTEDRNGLNGTVTVTGGGNTYTATAGTDGRATINVVSGVTYTVSTTVTGFNGGSQLVIAESATIKYVRFDVIKTSVGTDTKPVKFVNGAPVAVPNDFVDVATTQEILGTKTFKSSEYAGVYIKSDRISGNLGGIEFKSGDTLKSQIIGNASGDIKLQPSNAVTIITQRAYNSSNINDVVTIGTLQTSTDVVHTTGNETIGGTKSFTGSTWVRGDTEKSYNIQNSSITRGTTPSSNTRTGSFRVTGLNDATLGEFYHVCGADGSSQIVINAVRNASSRADLNLTLVHKSDGTGFVTAPYRTSSITTNDVLTAGNGVTLGTNQEISAIKQFTNTDAFKIKNTVFGTGTFTFSRMVWTSNGNDFWGDVDLTHQGDTDNTKFIEMVVSNDGGTANIARAQLCVNSSQAWMMIPHRGYNASNISDVVTIGLLQASTDVVHRSGNETISGMKTFSTVTYKNTNGLTRAQIATVNDWTWLNGFEWTSQDGYRVGDIRRTAYKDNVGVVSTMDFNILNSRNTEVGIRLFIRETNDETWVTCPAPPYGYSALRNIVVSSGSPSGGYDGDVWIQH